MLPTHRKPTQPGKILLEEFLIPLQITPTEFTFHLGGSLTQPKLSAVICGKRSITEEITLDFTDALGTSPEFWMGLQTDINLWQVDLKRKKIKPFRIRKGRLRGKVKFQ
jgi:addiction module HigA family antidote